VPQLLALVVVSTHVLPQRVGVDAGQFETQADPLQMAAPPLQTWPQDPQLFLSVVTSTHAPLQGV
jgi:hypothetical protein